MHGTASTTGRRTSMPTRSGRGGEVTTVPTYYNQGGISVTSQELVIQDRRYRIDELDELVVARGSYSRGTAGCITTACLFLVLASWSWQVPAVPVALRLVTTAVAAGCLVGALVSQRVRPRAYELWASYRHHTVQLLWSRDERAFNQIRFAICRARQAHPGRTRA